MNITFDEQQLMSLYNPGTREGLIAELTDSAIAKLNGMSDAEYEALDLFPDFEKEDMDAE